MSKLFCPGPIDIPEIVKATISLTPPHFASKKFGCVLKKIQPQLQHIFQTENPVLLITGSGSLAMQECITNFFSPSQQVLIINSGRYGNNWVKCAKEYGLSVIDEKANLLPEYGEFVDLNTIREILIGFPSLKGVLVQHVESTTGIKNNIEAIGELIRQYTPNTLFIVDAISSFLSEEVKTDEWGIDCLLCASQKGFSLPPGLSMMVVSEKAMIARKGSTFPHFYFDVLEEYERQIVKHQSRFTPNVPVIMGLSKVLDILHTPDFLPHNCIRRAASFAATTRKAFKDFGISVYPSLPCNTITVGVLPNDVSPIFFDVIEDTYGIVVGRGMDFLQDRGIRIRHFGWELQEVDVVQIIYAISETLIKVRNIKEGKTGKNINLERR